MTNLPIYNGDHPTHIMEGMDDDKRLLASKNAELRRLIEQRAEAERVYNVAMSQKIMELRAGGEPVSVIKDLVKGDKHVSQLKLNYEIALGIENACRESMKDVRSSIDAARSKLTWLRAERFNQ